MKTCPKCGAEADGIFCINCGAAINSEPAPAPVSKPADVEKPMGTPYQQPTQPQQPYYPPAPQQPVQEPGLGVELLLCFFLGGFGVHKFYRKKIGMGLLYLITGGLFGIGWLVDTISLFVKWIKTL